ncbi:DsbA family protein [Streptomyces sp. NPDC087917]|uniref:DsbA family oxidoreductase n=1 Tax=unclassified Streptomyces TaxID=2593676 RepID=UPI003423E92A
MTGRPEGEPALEVVEYTDPLCPWAWGSEPVFRTLRAALGDRVRWRRVFCILFDEGDDPPPDPAAETAWYARYVEEITAHTRAPRAVRLSRVAAGSWPASLVAKAAERQGVEVADRVLRRLRESVFVLGEPADTTALALAAVRGVPGLDPDRLSADAAGAAVLGLVRADHREARRPVSEVLSVRGGSPHPGAAKETDTGHRYALPTLLFLAPGSYRAVPGRRTFEEYAQALRELDPALPPAFAPLSPTRTLERYRSLSGPELLMLTGAASPPPGAVRVETGNGPLWLHPEEAAVHPATAPGSPSAR